MAAVKEDPHLRIRTAPTRSASPARQRLQITVPRVRNLAMQMGSPRTQRNQLNSPRAQKLQMSSYLSPVTQGAYITLVLADKLTHFSGVGVMTCPAYWLVSDEKFTVIRPVEESTSWLRPHNVNVHLSDNESLSQNPHAKVQSTADVITQNFLKTEGGEKTVHWTCPTKRRSMLKVAKP